MNNVSLTTEECKILVYYARKIRQIPLYQTGKIDRILRELDHASDSIQEWRDQVIEAAIHFDQDTYLELMSEVQPAH